MRHKIQKINNKLQSKLLYSINEHKGFTLIEMIAVISILLILSTTVIFGLVGWYNWANFIKANSTAEEIFMASETQLAGYSADGTLDDFTADLKDKNGKFINALGKESIAKLKNEDGEAYDINSIWKSSSTDNQGTIIFVRANQGDYIKYQKNQSDNTISPTAKYVFKMLNGRIDNPEVLNSSIIIEFSPDGGQILSASYNGVRGSLYYSAVENKKPTSDAVDISDRRESVRRETSTGYYGVDTLSKELKAGIKKSSIEKVTINNENTLNVAIQGTKLSELGNVKINIYDVPISDEVNHTGESDPGLMLSLNFKAADLKESYKYTPDAAGNKASTEVRRKTLPMEVTDSSGKVLAAAKNVPVYYTEDGTTQILHVVLDAYDLNLFNNKNNEEIKNTYSWLSYQILVNNRKFPGYKIYATVKSDNDALHPVPGTTDPSNSDFTCFDKITYDSAKNIAEYYVSNARQLSNIRTVVTDYTDLSKTNIDTTQLYLKDKVSKNDAVNIYNHVFRIVKEGTGDGTGTDDAAPSFYTFINKNHHEIILNTSAAQAGGKELNKDSSFTAIDYQKFLDDDGVYDSGSKEASTFTVKDFPFVTISGMVDDCTDWSKAEKPASWDVYQFTGVVKLGSDESKTDSEKADWIDNSYVLKNFKFDYSANSAVSTENREIGTGLFGIFGGSADHINFKDTVVKGRMDYDAGAVKLGHSYATGVFCGEYVPAKTNSAEDETKTLEKIYNSVSEDKTGSIDSESEVSVKGLTNIGGIVGSLRSYRSYKSFFTGDKENNVLTVNEADKINKEMNLRGCGFKFANLINEENIYLGAAAESKESSAAEKNAGGIIGKAEVIAESSDGGFENYNKKQKYEIIPGINISDCINCGIVTGTENIGGIAGLATNAILNSDSEDESKDVYKTAADVFGGTDYNNVLKGFEFDIENCTGGFIYRNITDKDISGYISASGESHKNRNIGGIIGKTVAVAGTEIDITGCTVNNYKKYSGTVNVSGYNCILGFENAGGIIGTSATPSTIFGGAENADGIVRISDTETRTGIKINAYRIAANSCAGGIIGSGNAELNAENGDIEISGDLIYGNSNSGDLNSAGKTNSLEIFADHAAGGLAGVFEDKSELTVKNSKKINITGTVYGNDMIGGLAGINACEGIYSAFGADNTVNAAVEFNDSYVLGRRYIGGIFGLNSVSFTKDAEVHFNIQNSGDFYVNGLEFTGGIIGLDTVPETIAASGLNENGYHDSQNLWYKNTASGLIQLCEGIDKNSGESAADFETFGYIRKANWSSTAVEGNSAGKYKLPKCTETASAFNGVKSINDKNTKNNQKSFTIYVINGAQSNGSIYVSANDNVGGIIGTASDNSNIKIKDTVNTAHVTALTKGELNAGYTYAGGIIGMLPNNSTIDNCSNSDNALIKTSGTYLGALTETNDGTIINCTSNSISSDGNVYVGGLAAVNNGTINNSAFAVNGLISSKGSAGGFTAINKGTIDFSASSANVSIFSVTSTNSAGLISAICDGAGIITAKGAIGSQAGENVTVTSDTGCAGIAAGEFNSTGNLTFDTLSIGSNAVTGTVTVKAGTYAGGVFGNIASDGNVTFKKCVNNASVSSTGIATQLHGAGGIIGGYSYTKGSLTVNDCVNTENGAVTSSVITGGTAEITAGGIVGSVAGDNASVQINNCRNYYTGAENAFSGIVGAGTVQKLVNCFDAGKNSVHFGNVTAEKCTDASGNQTDAKNSNFYISDDAYSQQSDVKFEAGYSYVTYDIFGKRFHSNPYYFGDCNSAREWAANWLKQTFHLASYDVLGDIDENTDITPSIERNVRSKEKILIIEKNLCYVFQLRKADDSGTMADSTATMKKLKFVWDPVVDTVYTNNGNTKTADMQLGYTVSFNVYAYDENGNKIFNKPYSQTVLSSAAAISEIDLSEVSSIPISSVEIEVTGVTVNYDKKNNKIKENYPAVSLRTMNWMPSDGDSYQYAERCDDVTESVSDAIKNKLINIYESGEDEIPLYETDDTTASGQKLFVLSGTKITDPSSQHADRKYASIDTWYEEFINNNTSVVGGVSRIYNKVTDSTDTATEGDADEKTSVITSTGVTGTADEKGTTEVPTDDNSDDADIDTIEKNAGVY